MDDFKQLLKGLGKQAKAEQEQQQQREQEAATKGEAEEDIAKETGAGNARMPPNRAPRAAPG